MPAQVLIADDDVALAENISEILAGFSIESVIVATAAEALQRAQEGAFGVALVDLHLPDGSGSALSRTLHQQGLSTRVILITGDATVETAITAVSDGAFAYVLKPFAPARLVETVQRALEQAALLQEKARLRAQLEASERRYRDLAEAIPALVLTLDQEGRIIFWNRRLEELTGFSRDEMLGQPGAAIIATGETAALPVKDGASRLVRWESARVDGSVHGVGIDVTTEQQMLRRTMRAERLAAVGTMAAGLAHEIRNPLNAAQLQLALLARRLQKPELDRQRLSTIGEVVQGEIARLERLVNEFLAFARPGPLSMKAVDMTALCKTVLHLMGPEAEGTGIAVKSALQTSLPAVEGDPERLTQVLLNLIRNALEAMDGGGTLSVGTTALGDTVLVTVEDTGVGITDDASIFDAFYTTKPTGTGLGLSLVHRIVSDHGGQISVESRPGLTRFTITLPTVRPG